MKILKSLYVILVWIYSISVLAFFAILPPMFIIDFLSTTFPYFDGLINMQSPVGMIISGVIFLVVFFILYIPVVLVMFLPVLYFKKKAKINIGF